MMAEKQAPGHSSKGAEPGQGWRRIFQPLGWLASFFPIQNVKPAKLGLASVLFFLGFSALAYQQFRRPYHWHEPYRRFSSSWWLHPAEWNLDAGLPKITGNINTVLLAGDGKLWIAGDSGLLAFSNDQGDSWTLLEFDASGSEFRVPQTNAQTNSERGALVLPAQPGLRLWPAVVSTVYAATESGDSKSKSHPESQASAPRPEVQHQTSTTASIVARPRSLSFGGVQVGSANPQKFEFQNVSKQPTMLTLDALASKDFRIEKDDCIKVLLQPGESCSIVIVFSPRAVGRTVADLRASTQSGDYIDVPLSGIGQTKPAGISKSSNVSPPARVWQPPPQAPDLVELEPGGKELTATSATADYVSNDGGAHWLARQRPTAPAPGSSNVTTDFVRIRISNTDSSQANQLLAGIRKLDPKLHTLKEAAFPADRQRGWVVGLNGVVFRTFDGGAHWYPATQSARSGDETDDPYVRFLPPWYWLALLFCGVLAAPLLAPPGERAQESEAEAEWSQRLPPLDSIFSTRSQIGNIAKSAANQASGSPSSIADQAVADEPVDPPSRPLDGIGNKAISDKPLEPGEPDALGLGAIAAGLAFFLRNDKTRPPLAIGINGPWGSGKSSLMNLLRKSLEDSGSRPVWFNAWHHQKEEQLLAALLQAVKAQAVPLWSSWSGWIFRARLAAIRVHRSWFPLTVLGALLILMYLVEVFLHDECHVTFGSLLYFIFAGPSENKLTSFLDLMKANANHVVTLTAGIIAALRALSHGLTAFGTNPASLLTTMSGGTKVKDLDAQTSFRQRFAAEFADVTKALGDRRRMLILIDDLDRCRPEKVREVLEAVNFLVSSGDCFIVLGMARDIVEHCVGLSFRSTVDTLSWDSMGLSQEEVQRFVGEAQAAAAEGGGDGNAAGQQSVAVEVAAKRRAFARLYLDKLIQIEVAVPEPTLLQKRLLFQTEEEQGEKPRNERRAEKVLKIADAGSAVLAPWIRATLVACLVIAAGLLAGHPIKPMARSLIASLSGPGKPQPDASPGAGARQPPDAKRSASGGAPEPPTPPVREQPQIQPGIAGAQLGWLALWPFYLMGLVAIGLVSTALRRVPERTITDTKPFVNALNIWHPLVMTSGARNTPRTARRFQNRVRYLAMRQRALSQGPPQSMFERWVRRNLKAEVPKPYPLIVLPESGRLQRAIDEECTQLRELMEGARSGDTPHTIVREGASGMEVTSKNGSRQEVDFLLSLVRGWVYIPEPLLVALAAIEEYEPQWIKEEALFRQFVDFPPGELNALLASPSGKPYAMFFAAALAHIKNWPGWYNMLYYRRAYMELSNGPCSSTETARLENMAAGH